MSEISQGWTKQDLLSQSGGSSGGFFSCLWKMLSTTSSDKKH
jgi:hypothetical protein